MTDKKAIILFSGGLDSTTVLAMAYSVGYECHLLSFDYGQNHIIELERAKEIGKSYSVANHHIITLDLKSFAKSSLLGQGNVPKHSDLKHLDHQEVPTTYVPARNTIFLSYAFAYAESFNISNIFIGCNALDYSNYPDCRPEYIEQFQSLMNIASGMVIAPIKIHAPLLHLTKYQIIMSGIKLGVAYDATISCYNPNRDGLACGHCDSCLLRKRGFEQAGVLDPTLYEISSIIED
jgi:7-cyano-7-deazaguanine synthase